MNDKIGRVEAQITSLQNKSIAQDRVNERLFDELHNLGLKIAELPEKLRDRMEEKYVTKKEFTDFSSTTAAQIAENKKWSKVLVYTVVVSAIANLLINFYK